MWPSFGPYIHSVDFIEIGICYDGCKLEDLIELG